MKLLEPRDSRSWGQYNAFCTGKNSVTKSVRVEKYSREIHSQANVKENGPLNRLMLIL